jgi:murein DD-endopeptidase MepM/ murein hydrolase activator NlpD
LFDEVVGFDHDGPEPTDDLAASVRCTTYDGGTFPDCYDGHEGNDFILEGGFQTMDAGSTEVIAAAPGVVVRTRDGEYDRCRATLDGVDCDGHPMRANLVYVAHDWGLTSTYLHLKTGSVAVAVGDVVDRGDVLGLVGSSGFSSLPHLHFEVVLSDGRSVDPYAGERSQPTSMWCEQDAGDGLPGDCE